MSKNPKLARTKTVGKLALVKNLLEGGKPCGKTNYTARVNTTQPPRMRNLWHMPGWLLLHLERPKLYYVAVGTADAAQFAGQILPQPY